MRTDTWSDDEVAQQMTRVLRKHGEDPRTALVLVEALACDALVGFGWTETAAAFETARQELWARID